MMFLGQTARQKSIANGTRKRDINHHSRMDMADFPRSKPEFSSAKPMGMDGNARPPRHFLLKCFKVVHSKTPLIPFSMPGPD